MKIEKRGLAEATGEEEEVMAVEAAAVMVEAEAMVEAVEATVKGGEAGEVMEEEEAMGETDRPSAIAALSRWRKAKKSMSRWSRWGDVEMELRASTILLSSSLARMPERKSKLE